MAYALDHKDKTLQAGVRRIAADQIRSAIAKIDDPALGRDETIHQVRKRCKKLRGLVRLVRPGFDGYRTENACFRDASRRLSGYRDADVLIETYDKLVGHFEAEIDRRAFGQIRRRLTLRRKAVLEQDRTGDELAAFRIRMEEALARTQAWKLDSADTSDVALGGMAKTYRRARRAMKAARGKPSDERMHEWRKRVKYHRFHAQLLRRIWPAPMLAHAEAADRLGDILGDHHDLAVFADEIRADPAAFGPDTTPRVAVALVERRKRELEAEAFALGARLFAEKPKRIAARWGTYWRAWHAVSRGGRGTALRNAA